MLLWHAGLPGISAGFIGVDIFFVLSGYLITNLLVQERATSGTISLGAFYARRARRLLPASALVIVVTLAASIVIMPTLRHHSISLDAIASTLYVENWRLAGQAVDYGAAETGVSPLQHYWSLSVEEQFYLVWPLLMLLVMRGARGFVRSGRYRRRLMSVMALVVVATFVYSIIDSYRAPNPAYFLTLNRVWQFGLGGLLAVWERSRRAIGRRTASALAAAGVVTLIAAAVLIDTEAPYPGLSALAPAAGTLAVLAGGAAASTTRAGKLATSKPILRIGDLSYTLYLWHWPMLVLADELLDGLTTPVALVIVVASVIPSLLTERLVERPVRFSRPLARPNLALSMAAGIMVVSVGVAGYVASTSPTLTSADSSSNPFADQRAEAAAPATTTPTTVVLSTAGAPPVSSATPTSSAATTTLPPALLPGQRLGAETLVDLDGTPLAAPDVDTTGNVIYPVPGSKSVASPVRCITRPDGREIRDNCNVNGDPAAPVIALVGDSHAAQWRTLAYRAAIENGWTIRFYLKQGCSLSLAERDPSCQDWIGTVQAALTADPPDVVILGAGNPGRGSAERTDAFVNAWAPLRQAGVQVVVLADSPRPEFNMAECVYDHRDDLDACAFSQEDGASGRDLVAAMQPGDELIDLNPLICPQDPCPAVIGQVMVYRDTNHLTEEYVRTLEVPFKRRLVEIVTETAAAGGASPDPG